MAYFGVGVNLGSFRTTKHEFRLNFQLRTTVKPSESVIIPLHGLSVVSLEEIFGTEGDSAYLVGNLIYISSSSCNFILIMITYF